MLWDKMAHHNLIPPAEIHYHKFIAEKNTTPSPMHYQVPSNSISMHSDAADSDGNAVELMHPW